MNSTLSPNLCRLRMNQRTTTISAVHSACNGSCAIQTVSEPANGRPTITRQTELSSAPRSA